MKRSSVEADIDVVRPDSVSLQAPSSLHLLPDQTSFASPGVSLAISSVLSSAADDSASAFAASVVDAMFEQAVARTLSKSAALSPNESDGPEAKRAKLENGIEVPSTTESKDAVITLDSSAVDIVGVVSENVKSGDPLEQINHLSESIVVASVEATKLLESQPLDSAVSSVLQPDPSHPTTAQAAISIDHSQLTEAAPQHPVQRSQNIPTELDKLQLRHCHRVLARAKRLKDATIFLQPVDPVLLNIPTYFDIIKRPMDISTIQKKLDTGAYSSAHGFIDDVNLMFQNCWDFNGRDSIVGKMATNLQKYFAKQLEDMPQSLPVPKSKAASIPPSQVIDRPKRDVQPPPRLDSEMSPPRSRGLAGNSTFVNPSSKYQLDLKHASSVVRELHKAKYYSFAFPFLTPVDHVRLNIPTYPQIIKHPMDFGTILRRVDQGYYRTPQEFESDCRLVFSNCYTFNAPGSDVFLMGQQLEQVFNARWRERPSLKAAQTAPRGSISGISAGLLADDSGSSSEEEQDLSKMQENLLKLMQEVTKLAAHKGTKKKKEHKKAAKMHALLQQQQQVLAAAASASVGAATVPTSAPKKKKRSRPRPSRAAHPGVIQEITFPMKQELSEKIGDLSPDKLEGVYQIIKSGMPTLDTQAAGQDEIELDIDSLDKVTLSRLYNFVIDAASSKNTSTMPKPKSLSQNSSDSDSDSAKELAEKTAPAGPSASDAAFGVSPQHIAMAEARPELAISAETTVPQAPARATGATAKATGAPSADKLQRASTSTLPPPSSSSSSAAMPATTATSVSKSSTGAAGPSAPAVLANARRSDLKSAIAVVAAAATTTTAARRAAGSGSSNVDVFGFIEAMEEKPTQSAASREKKDRVAAEVRSGESRTRINRSIDRRSGGGDAQGNVAVVPSRAVREADYAEYWAQYAGRAVDLHRQGTVMREFDEMLGQQRARDTAGGSGGSGGGGVGRFEAVLQRERDALREALSAEPCSDTDAEATEAASDSSAPPRPTNPCARPPPMVQSCDDASAPTRPPGGSPPMRIVRHNEVDIMRRASDGWVNATQILKAAGSVDSGLPAIVVKALRNGTAQYTGEPHPGIWYFFMFVFGVPRLTSNRRVPECLGMELAKQHKLDLVLRRLFENESNPPPSVENFRDDTAKDRSNSEVSRSNTKSPENEGKVDRLVLNGAAYRLIIFNNCRVMQREDDGWVNATHILNAANVTRSERAKILHKEIKHVDHEVLQSRNFRTQGTWVPHEFGVELAKRYNIGHIICPFLATSKGSSAATDKITASDSRERQKLHEKRQLVASKNSPVDEHDVPAVARASEPPAASDSSQAMAIRATTPATPTAIFPADQPASMAAEPKKQSGLLPKTPQEVLPAERPAVPTSASVEAPLRHSREGAVRKSEGIHCSVGQREKRGFVPLTPEAQAQLKRAREIVKEIMAEKRYREFAMPFLWPVDHVLLDLPMYPQVVKHPMDFGTIQKRINVRAYRTVSDLERDCRQVFKNCFLFNSKRSYVYAMGKKLESVFEELWTAAKLPNIIENSSKSKRKAECAAFAGQQKLLNLALSQPFAMSACCAILERTMRTEMAAHFINPVDTDTEENADYYKIISNPINLKVIRERLENGEYSRSSKFFKDLGLIFQNTWDYYGVEHHLSHKAVKMQQYFIEEFSKVPGNEPDDEGQLSDRHSANGHSRVDYEDYALADNYDASSIHDSACEEEQETQEILRSAILMGSQRDPDLHVNKKQKLTNFDEVSFAQKQHLGEMMAKLSRTQLECAYMIVRSGMPELDNVAAGLDEVEIDMNSLDAQTLSNLYTYVYDSFVALAEGQSDLPCEAPISFETKQELSEKISALDAHQLEEVFRIVVNGRPELESRALEQDEIELRIELLDDKTVKALLDFVDTVAKRTASFVGAEDG
ncbi:hypothetical protein HDU84_001260 [Entophlyctis sp. JEL0112]|nr:hypothetical protein HDU84_001260 [Entophlyctis sp. JEL0112]